MEELKEPQEFVKCRFAACGKLLSSKYNLKRHIDSCHNGKKPFECRICFKQFSSRQNKREHIRLEHSYSFESKNQNSTHSESHEIQINPPKLTALLLNSFDPDLRPFSKIEKLYLFSDLLEKVELSTISENLDAEVTLPCFFTITDNGFK